MCPRWKSPVFDTSWYVKKLVVLLVCKVVKIYSIKKF
nr:MAG TPA: hypothetical protein [Caudoviricetes sp.]